MWPLKVRGLERSELGLGDCVRAASSPRGSYFVLDPATTNLVLCTIGHLLSICVPSTVLALKENPTLGHFPHQRMRVVTRTLVEQPL